MISDGYYFVKFLLTFFYLYVIIPICYKMRETMKKQLITILFFLSLFNINQEASSELKKEIYRDNTISFDFIKEIQLKERQESIKEEIKMKDGLEEKDNIQKTNTEDSFFNKKAEQEESVDEQLPDSDEDNL